MKILVKHLLAFAVLLSAPLLAAENNVKALKVQLLKMADQLKSEDHQVIKGFITKYAIGEGIESIPDDKLDEVVTNFTKNKKAELRAYLLVASKMVPEISPDKLSYKYTLKDDEFKGIKKSLVLIYSKKTKHFHINNQ